MQHLTTASIALRSRLVLAIVAVAAALLPFAPASAQSAYFVERFMGAKLGAHLVDADGQFDLRKGYVERSGNEASASTNRHYITTVHADYIARDWTYDITVLSPATAPDDILFIGFGEATPDPTYFNEPRNSINFRIHQGATGFGNGWRVDVGAHSVGYAVFTYLEMGVGFLPPMAPEGSTFTVRIRKSGNAMTFRILGTPIEVCIPDVRAYAPFLDETNSRVFFGNASGDYSFADMRVLPPSVDH
jgi:hypothetical protein